MNGITLVKLAAGEGQGADQDQDKVPGELTIQPWELVGDDECHAPGWPPPMGSACRLSRVL